MANFTYSTAQLDFLQAFGQSSSGLLGLQQLSLPSFNLGGLTSLFDGLLPDTFNGTSLSFTSSGWLAKVALNKHCLQRSLYRRIRYEGFPA